LRAESIAGRALSQYFMKRPEEARISKTEAQTLNQSLRDLSYLKHTVQWDPELIKAWGEID